MYSAYGDSIAWEHPNETTWTAGIGGVNISTVQTGAQYELETVSGQTRGSHNSLSSAQAQLHAWNSWSSRAQ
ncbi:hypothetical protein [Curtobacterium sp. ISL-83]|uniref:hypothetical protein n=1 Tax=Curtobacterium sp. ISL-83 TaxID=2819145 RepID=UPI001BE754B6|nr:hypothetical protein [Curtobacterium sp. ISL-83]MBT2504154.1 hypothetical protein [Curtobacterium sp. ISL-83]